MIGLIVVLETKPTFGQLTDLLLTDADRVTFVCELLKTEGYTNHLHVFGVSREKHTPITFCHQNDLADFHPLALKTINDTMFIVPKYIIDDQC